MDLTTAIVEGAKALAALLWPGLGIAFLVTYRKEIRSLLQRLSRLKKGKFFDQEIIGEQVAWEWSFKKIWGKTWYKNKDGECERPGNNPQNLLVEA